MTQIIISLLDNYLEELQRLKYRWNYAYSTRFCM